MSDVRAVRQKADGFMLSGAPLRVLTESKDESVAVADNKLALAVHSVLGPIDDIGSTLPQLRRKRIYSGHVEVDVVSTISPVGANAGLISSIEVEPNLVAFHNSKDRRRSGVLVNLLAVPV
ncbi:MAG TPA: hypothetical protein VE967_05790, partial [Gemmatimonadaceae bacterium]|nr:hypothetical protein [Gemmatimonadaceae bacterium]